VTEEGAIWVGLLDLDDAAGPIVGVTGPVAAGHRQARVLIRMHRAPVGYVTVPALPMESLTVRARAAAEATLADALCQHARWDSSATAPDRPPEWTAQTACPRHFAPCHGAGVSIVVCTRDRATALQECLATLQRVTYHPIEIIVVDNAPSGDASRQAVTALARSDPRIRYTCEPRAGLSRARNRGLVHAQFDLVAFTDDDTLADPGWPSALAAGFAADPETVCVTGLVASGALDTRSQRYFDARIPWGEVFEPRRYDLITYRHPSPMYPFRAGIFGTGANFAVRRSAVTRIGGFDPLLGAGGPSRGGEDLDMFLRLILAGGRICYLPSAVIWHRHRADAEALSEQIYSYGHGLGAYVAKHLANRDMRHALVAHGVRQSGVLVARMHQATRESQLRAGGRRLALTEARGIMAGAVRYRRAIRRKPSPGTVQ
jgi:O-antigen biosynthesis protein